MLQLRIYFSIVEVEIGGGKDSCGLLGPAPWAFGSYLLAHMCIDQELSLAILTPEFILWHLSLLLPCPQAQDHSMLQVVSWI